MSDQENPPPQDPYGQQPPPYGQPSYGQQPPPYGQPQYGQPQYGQPQYGQQPYGQPGYPQPGYPQPGYGVPTGGYASWLQRVGAYLVDGLISFVAYLPAVVGNVLNTNASNNGDTSGVGLLLTLVGVIASIGVFVWNVCLRQGRTGCTIGKSALGIKLISESTGQPIGGGMSFVRQIAHILDAIPCYLGYLWPLWDGKRQTFADKILKTIVVNQPQG